ncbi:SCO family protein [Pontibacter anaerobius]|uniref:SCO family protein n=1 Tax=Pontibacter anaerobius TaxID=2993940 RepID=A0ABT3RBY7_9BACT|nr:SCO family protein [Pontibacter anaerobius]
MPILIFIFISVFGTHHFSLKTYYPKLDDAGRVVYNAAGDTVFQQLPYFKLNSHTGASVTSEALSEGLYVASFFNLPCADSCQKVFSQLVRVQEVFANNPQVKIVSVEVSPAADSTSTLDALAKEYQIREGKWYLLTGDKEPIQTLVKEGFQEPVRQEDGDLRPSQRLVLVDKEKKIRGVYEGADPEDVDRLILEINVLLDEYSKRK